MRVILFIGFILIARLVACGQSRKIIFGGKQTDYYRAFTIHGDVDSHTEYELSDSLPDGEYAFYNDLDTTYLMYEVGFKKAKLHGYYRSYYDNRQLKEETFYKAGKKQFSKQFYKNGKLKEENTIPYFDYNSDGTAKLYYPSGQLEEMFVHKHNHGKLISYYESGQIRYIHSYLITKESGTCTTNLESFYPDGKVKRTEFYKNCYRDGFVSYFDEKGKKEKEELYVYEHLCFQFTFPKNCYETIDMTFGNGNRLTGEYQDCKKTGTWKYYKWQYGELKLEKEELYENDALIHTIKH
jgi:antitoxin component YwqK of YwqJK toxin-antitoxin module